MSPWNTLSVRRFSNLLKKLTRSGGTASNAASGLGHGQVNGTVKPGAPVVLGKKSYAVQINQYIAAFSSYQVPGRSLVPPPL